MIISLLFGGPEDSVFVLLDAFFPALSFSFSLAAFSFSFSLAAFSFSFPLAAFSFSFSFSLAAFSFSLAAFSFSLASFSFSLDFSLFILYDPVAPSGFPSCFLGLTMELSSARAAKAFLKLLLNWEDSAFSGQFSAM